MALQNYRAYIALTLVAIGLQVFTTAAEARLYTGVVTRVTDGDTFWVRTSAHGEPRKVRFQGGALRFSARPVTWHQKVSHEKLRI